MVNGFVCEISLDVILLTSVYSKSSGKEKLYSVHQCGFNKHSNELGKNIKNI